MSDDELSGPSPSVRLLQGMREVAEAVGHMARVRGLNDWPESNAFTQFGGLMNKYVQLCETAHEAGQSFGRPFTVGAHHMQYLAEKVGRILWPVFAANPGALATFAGHLRALGLPDANELLAVVSSVKLDEGPAHDRLRIWNRHGFAGELVLQKGDGVRLAALLGRCIEDKW
jgi:hypothetical protein